MVDFKKKQGLINNVDVLNDRGYVRISAKSPKARELEKMGSALEQDSQNLKRAFAKGDDVIGRIKNAPMKSPHAGKGKLGALAMAITLGANLLKGEPVQASELIKSGAETVNPLPFGLDEIKGEMDKMDPMKKLQQLKAEKLKAAFAAKSKK